jgi:porin
MRLALPLALLAFIGICLANDESDRNYATETLTGDWSGLRSAWLKQGVNVEAGLKVDHMHNRRGASARGGTTMRHLDLKLRADLDPLFGLSGTTAYIHAIDDRGTGANDRHFGSLMGVSNIEVPVSTSRFFHAWIQQTFQEEQWALLVGLYPVDSEFSVMDSAGVLLHPAYGASAEFALTRGPSIFNNAAFGLRLKWQAPDRTLYAMGAVLDGIPGDPNNPKGTHIQFNKGDGTFSIAEIGWTPLEYGHVFEPPDPTRTLRTPEVREHEKYGGHSKYAAGLWRYSSQVNDQFDLDARGNSQQRHSWGGYLLAERTLLSLGEDPGRHLTAFARYAFTDGNSTPIRDQLNLGISLRGPFASLPNDAMALAWTGARLASKYRAAQWRDRVVRSTHGEDAIELTYRAALTPWFSLQPSLQWIKHPGGDAAVKDSMVTGLRLEIVL